MLNRILNFLADKVFLKDGSQAMTGDISYKGIQATTPAIKFKSAPTPYGNGIVIGSGGLTIIGSGESADTIYNKLIQDGYDAGEEIMFITSDNQILFRTNVNDGAASAKNVGINTKGHVVEVPEYFATTYTQNNYVTQASAERIYARKVGNFVCVFGNLLIDAALPSAQSITIGRISGLGTIVQNYAAQIPVSNGSTVNVSITATGEIVLYKYATTSTPAVGWARFCAMLITSD